ncbi:uncharacterized protein [Gossypium hirsutum]|uniref:Retrotransposon gag domain-containing protein n=1 Tax=Gossypium hirsutum TaxID=3635 RepID=A0A1U8NWF0_GOSHI|nr:uncharacterized protein LOC107952451 [Gossypium hirsutum]
MEVSDSFKLAGVSEDALRLMLFPYSLKDKAQAWLNSLPPYSITIWQELPERFLMKYFSPSKNAKLQNEITTFQQMDDESFQAAILKNLENQMGQLATELRNQLQGALPSDMENPRNLGKEHCEAMTLRSVKTLDPNTCRVEEEPVDAQDLVEV